MKNRNNQIQFIPSSEEVVNVVDPPKPSRTLLPEWYKAISPPPVEFHDDGSMTRNVKNCVPFLDALRAGWIQETWTDIHFKSEQSGDIRFHYSTNPKPLDARGGRSGVSLRASSHQPVELVWKMPWIPKTPSGWSVLVTSPINRLDLPFSVASGIIDSDNFYHVPFGSLPFYIERGFEGVIPAGTPMYQIIPIKRTERWGSTVLPFNERECAKRFSEITRKFTGAYRDSFWVRKRYE
jgi:hypothetical protein